MSEWLESLPDEDTAPRPERRGDFRLQHSVKARVEGGGLLHLVNLSASGFRATGPEGTDDEFVVTLELEELGVPVRARRVWSRELDYAGLCDAGYRFVDLGEAERSRLLAFIRSKIADQW